MINRYSYNNQFHVNMGRPIIFMIFDMLGREMRILVSRYHTAGSYSVYFDGKGIPSGVYISCLSSGGHIDRKKMILIR